MTHEANAAVRSAAIKDLGRRFRKPSRQSNSTSLSRILGDTQSLLSLFAQSSVTDVKHLCVVISNIGRHGRQQESTFQETQQAVERLLRALLPAVYPPQTMVGCLDKRALQHLYAIMLPACPAEFIEAVLDARDPSNPLYRWRDVSKLTRSHRALFKKRAENHLFGLATNGDPDVHYNIAEFLKYDRAFALSALHGRHHGTITDQRWGAYPEGAIALSLVHRLVRRKHASKESVAVQVRDLVQLGLGILAKKPPTTRNNRRSDDIELWTFALNGWRKRPELFEDALVLGLQLGLGSSPNSAPRDYLSAATRPGFPEEKRQRMLQLYCLHVVKDGCDIFAEDARFVAFANSPWPHEVFNHLEVEQSTRLLKELEAVNLEYNFLEAPSSEVSILGCREVAGRKNFNVSLLLTQLQREDPENRQRARETVDELRRKAATAREQADRAEFAEAASAYAIATGDLDLYGDTIFWQQRFVRDPLTARRIFGCTGVLTAEGVGLLSAIQGSTGLHKDELIVRIRKADNILKTLYGAYRLAKREPTFQPSDWVHVKSLFGRVYQMRVQDLQTQRDSALSTIVCNGFLAAIEWMDVEFLSQIYDPAMDLLRSLSSTLLATTTQDLLRFGTQRRKEQNRTEEDDLLERMSYEALKMLAGSNTSALASGLVVQTIMERPDASSWHRQLLSTGFLKRLRAREAHDVLVDLAKAIGNKLEEQSYVRVGETEPTTHAPPKSMVKVTTVKYLAQLLNNADFISKETAVEVLVELFENAQHPDIHLAALESLLSLLDRLCTEAKAEWAANPTVDTIMRALEMMVPVAGSVNERHPPREEDWLDAEATGVLPEIGDAQAAFVQMPPLMNVLLMAGEGTRYRGLKVIQKALVERIVLPILRQSQVEHRRWIKLFLAKYKAPFAASDVPPTPVAVYARQRVLASCYPLVRPALLADFDAYAVHQIEPDARVQEFTAALRADVKLRKRADVQHWVRVFDYRVNSFSQSGTFILLGLMKTQYDTSLRVEYGFAVEKVVQHAKLFLDHYEEYARVWDEFMACLAPNWTVIRSLQHHCLWQDTHGSIVRQISDEIRKRKAQETHNILPSRTRLELWLLPFRTLADGDGRSELVARLEHVLLSLLESDESQIFDWANMAEDVCSLSELLVDDQSKAKVANEFGKLTDNEDVASRVGSARVQTRRALDLIKVKVAMHLLDDCKDVAVVKGAGEERLKEWRACESEAIRERVFKWTGKARIARA